MHLFAITPRSSSHGGAAPGPDGGDSAEPSGPHVTLVLNHRPAAAGGEKGGRGCLLSGGMGKGGGGAGQEGGEGGEGGLLSGGVGKGGVGGQEGGEGSRVSSVLGTGEGSLLRRNTIDSSAAGASSRASEQSHPKAVVNQLMDEMKGDMNKVGWGARWL